jgi:tetratricopeptide (TPR) repeat protein
MSDLDQLLASCEEALREAYEQSEKERFTMYRYQDIFPFWPGKALALAQQAYALDPDNAKVNYVCGAVAHLWKDIEKSIPFYERAMALDPKNADYQADYAVALWEVGNKEKGEFHIQQARELNSLQGDFDYTLGWMKEANGKTEEAVTLYQLAYEKLTALPKPGKEDQRFLSHVNHTLYRLDADYRKKETHEIGLQLEAMERVDTTLPRSPFGKAVLMY